MIEVSQNFAPATAAFVTPILQQYFDFEENLGSTNLGLAVEPLDD